MKAEAVKLIEGPYKMHYVKKSGSKVFLPLELNEGMYNQISSILNKDAHFELAAQYLNTPMVFYPKSANTTLVNFGPFTSALNNSASTSDIASKMYELTSKAFR